MAADPTAYMLTTIDNPWNPYTNWDEWYAYDQAMGYNTPGYLARVANVSFDNSEADQDKAIRDAIDEIVDLNLLGIYIKISKDEIVKVKGTGGGSS